jgi:hypothetical protein
VKKTKNGGLVGGRLVILSIMQAIILINLFLLATNSTPVIDKFLANTVTQAPGDLPSRAFLR